MLSGFLHRLRLVFRRLRVLLAFTTRPPLSVYPFLSWPFCLRPLHLQHRLAMRVLQFSYSLFLVLLHFLYPVDVGFERCNGARASDHAGD